MKKTAKKIVGGIWIGKNIKAKQETNPKHPEIKGNIVDETKNTFLLQTARGLKRIIKKTMNFEIEHDKKKLEVKGSLLQGRVEDRMTKKVNK